MSTTEMIKKAQNEIPALFEAINEPCPSIEKLTAGLNAIDYYLNRALDEAEGDEHVLNIRDKLLNRKRTRIKDWEEELQVCYKALNDMSDRCDRLHEQNETLSEDCKGTEAALSDTQNRLTIAEDECHFYKQVIDSTRNELKTRIGTIEELYGEIDTRKAEYGELLEENAMLQAKLDKQNEIIMKMLYDLPIS